MQEAIRTIFEFIAVILLIWGFYNEQKFVEFERKVFRYFRKQIIRKINSVNN